MSSLILVNDTGDFHPSVYTYQWRTYQVCSFRLARRIPTYMKGVKLEYRTELPRYKEEQLYWWDMMKPLIDNGTLRRVVNIYPAWQWVHVSLEFVLAAKGLRRTIGNEGVDTDDQALGFYLHRGKTTDWADEYPIEVRPLDQCVQLTFPEGVR